MFRGAITLKVAIGTSAIWGLTAGAASGATRYVSTHGNDGPTCGRSSAASTGATGPCKTLGGAVTVAKSGDKIKLAPGTYADTNVTIAKSLKLVGAGPKLTILDGASSHHVLSVGTTGASVSLVIARLEIRNGKATIGGGILSQTGGGGTNSVTLSNVLLFGNKAIGTSAGTQAVGGGIYADNNTTLAVRASTVTKNRAYGFVPVGTGKTGAVSAYGGGIFSAGTLKISASLISSNMATGGTYTKGRNTLAWTSVAYPAGGGGIESDGTMVMSHTTVDDNRVLGGGNDPTLPYPSGWLTPGGDGGGIRTSAASRSIISTSAITHNSAAGGGGGLTSGNGAGTPGGAGIGGGLSLAGDVHVFNTTIAGNSTVGGGGGVGTVRDYPVPHNVGGAAEGGGVSIGNGATVQLGNVTVAGNTGKGGHGGWQYTGAVNGEDGYAYAGGIMTFPGGTLRLASSIVAQNKPGSAGVPSRLVGNPPQPTLASPVSDCEGQVTSLGYNLIGLARTDEQGAPGCTGFRPSDQAKHSGTDPLLEPLGAYGGPTATMALKAGSPAIDAGTPNAAACAPADQRGFARVGRCDVGAFEYQPPTA